MHEVRADRGDRSRRGPGSLRVARPDGAPARPAWRILAATVLLAMALWATGIVELPESDRRLVDWTGGLSVLSILVVWVRRNGTALAIATQPPDHHSDDPLRIRLIRSRRPPLPEIGGPDIRPSRRRASGTHGSPPS
jgi:hypothetical protein